MQQNSAHFEEGIVRSIQSAWQTFDEWQSRMSSSVQDTWRILGSSMASLAPDREWISFSARSDHLIDPETPLRNPEYILYPSKEDPSVVPVHVGMMERKKRFTRSWRESYFVLTPAGFLHEYGSSDPAAEGGHSPMFSLFLPACTLGPTSSPSARSHKFHIESRPDGQGTTKAGGIGGMMGGFGSGHAWSFRARSHEDMMEWWNDIRMLCARYLVASEQMERSGPVHAAVRSAGYVSEEEDEGSEEGSSVEEEEDEEDEEEDEEDGLYQDAEVNPEYEGPPSYSHPIKAGGMEMGANGYPVEKKINPYSEGANHNHNYASGDPNNTSSVSRRPSQRQQEKAPEGRAPHVNGEEHEHDHHADVARPASVGADAGPAPMESKFQEELDE